MKKIYLLGAMASAMLAMTSCSSDEIAENNQQPQNAIEFGTYLGRNAETRAETNMTTEALQNKGFGVFAFYTAQDNWADYANQATPNFMNNQKVEYKTNAWTYSPLKYWPNNTGDKVSIFAYAPYDQAKTWAENKIEFEVKEKAADQTDLLFCPGHTNQGKPSTTNKIKFEFKHALSRIGFTVAYAADQTTAGGTLDANTKIVVKKVMLKAANGTEGGAFHKSGKLNLTATSADAAWEDGDLSSDKWVFTLEDNELQNTTVTATPQQLNTDKSYLMVIPKSTDFDVYVEYTVTTTDNNLTGKKSEITNKITTNVGNIDFKANYAYTLNLVLGMTSVKVEADVTGWENGGDTTVDVPANN